MKSRITAKIGVFAVLLGLLNYISEPAANAVVVTATGTDPSICDQIVNDGTGVIATRLSGGDCLVKFTSTTISYEWTAPANLYSLTYLIVGGGGSGGTGWDTTGAAGGGGGMVLTGTTSLSANSIYSVTVGAGGLQSTNGRGAYNGNNGSSSRFSNITAIGGGFGYTSRQNSGIAQAGGAAQVGSTSAPNGGSSGGGGSGGGGGGGANGAGNPGSGSSAGSGGAGLSNSITSIATTYGAGGAGGANTGTSTTGAAGGANTGKGGGGGIGGGASSASGGEGGSGVVIIRYSTSLASVNSFSLLGNPTTATFRNPTTINIDVSIPSKITFLANGKKISGCISKSANGSGSSYTATCNWKPTVRNSTRITDQIKPSSPGIATFSSEITISVVPRTGTR